MGINFTGASKNRTTPVVTSRTQARRAVNGSAVQPSGAQTRHENGGNNRGWLGGGSRPNGGNR